MYPEKKDRNIQIFLDKEGLVDLSDFRKKKTPVTYRELSRIHGISTQNLQRIVDRMRKRYFKKNGKPTGSKSRRKA